MYIITDKKCKKINNNNKNNNMAVRQCSQSKSHSTLRCCPCMKNGRCIRCQCIKKGLPCVDCWPSMLNPSRCENSRFHQDTATLSAQAVTSPSPRRPASATEVGSEGRSVETEAMASFLNQPKKVLKRIPRKSRTTVARKLATLVDLTASQNDIPSWTRLLQFPRKCLFTPPRGGR